VCISRLAFPFLVVYLIHYGLRCFLVLVVLLPAAMSGVFVVPASVGAGDTEPHLALKVGVYIYIYII